MAIHTHYSRCLCLSNIYTFTLLHTDTCYSFRSADTWAVATSNKQSLRPAVGCPEINLLLPPSLLHSWEFSQSDSSHRERPGRCKTGVGEKARNRHHGLSRTGDKASPACPGLCLSLVSGCGGCATERHTWHSNAPVKKQLRQRWDGDVWVQSCLVIPGRFTHWGWIAEDS